MKRDFYNTDIPVIDLKSLEAEFSAKIGEPVKIRSHGGLIRQPKLGLLDRWDIVLQEPKDEMFTLDIHKDIRWITLGGADWTVKVRVSDLEPHLGETIPIAESSGRCMGLEFGGSETNVTLLPGLTSLSSPKSLRAYNSPAAAQKKSFAEL